MWNSWICPTDRQLRLRSKLSKGWCNIYQHRPTFTTEELQLMDRVMRDNEALQAMERNRIRHYISKLESLKSLARGDGHSRCLLCGDRVSDSLLMRLLPKVHRRLRCCVCGLSTCVKCGTRPHGHHRRHKSSIEQLHYSSRLKSRSLDRVEPQTSPNDWQCKICHKEIQLWKKSGAWFYQRLPVSAAGVDSEEISQKSDHISDTEAEAEPMLHPYSAANSESNGLAAAGRVAKYGATATPERRPPASPSATQQQQQQPISTLPPGVYFEDRGLGTVHFVLQYIPGKAALYIRIIKGENLRAHDANGLSDPYVKVHLLPDTGKRTKLRTRTCQRTLNPLWDEEFCYSGITKAEIEAKMLRLSVLDEDTIGFEWMGEILYPLSHLLHSGKKEYSQIFLQPKNFELDRSLKLEDDDRGKILIGLYYAPAKNELTVRIIQCVNLIAMDPNGYSDPFVKLHLKPDDGTPKKCKTEFKRRTLNPEFEEEFQFIVTPQELLDKSLEITVWDKDFGSKNDFMGALVLGSECSGERRSHWEALLRQPYQRHERWHALWPELSM